MNIVPSNDEGKDADPVIAFLKDFQPEGPWCLTAINPDRKGVETKTFTPATEADLKSWLVYHNGRSNLYFHVNRVNGLLTKKAEREQIKFVDYLHVDVDPAAGKDMDAEQSRILAMFSPDGLMDRDMMPPTFLIFSGGGYQAFWKLDLPFTMNGTIEKAEEVARYNKQIELLFGGDKCHNVDRLMRLPWTQNIPTEKKRKLGRVQTQARVVQNRAGKSYPIENFQKAVVTANDDVKTNFGTVERIDNLDVGLEQWKVSDTIKAIIAQGRDPDNPKEKDDSRSAWLWHVLMALARADVPGSVMYSIITDPQWAISESILELGRGADKEAKRQVNKAIEHAIAPELLEMNEKYFCAMVGGKFRVGTVSLQPVLQRRVVSLMLDSDLRKHLKTRLIPMGKDKKGNPVFTPLFDWWFEHPKRRAYEGVVFDPSNTAPDNYYNLWQGWAVDAKPGDCGLFEAFVRDVICSGVEAHFEYLWRWMAWKVQNPEKQSKVAVVMKGKKGTGKSAFATLFGGLFGEAFFQAASTSEVTGQFNSHLRTCAVLFVDEAFFASDPKARSRIKTLITERQFQIEGKGLDIVTDANCMSVLMATNDDWAVDATADERRYFVLKVSEVRMQDSDYFDPMFAQMDKEGGNQTLLHELLTFDLGKWHPQQNLPKTDELNRQVELNLPPLRKGLVDIFKTGALPWFGIKLDCPHVTTRLLQKLLRQNVGAIFLPGEIEQELADLGWKRAKCNDTKREGFAALTLDETRKALGAKWGVRPAWPEDVTEWGEPMKAHDYNQAWTREGDFDWNA